MTTRQERELRNLGESFAKLVMALVQNHTLTFEQAEKIVGVNDADFLPLRPPGMSMDEAMSRLAAWHDRTVR